LKTFPQIIFALIIPLLVSCTDKHLINNKEYRDITEICFNQKEELAIERAPALFSVLNNKLSTKQTEALKFLYAYMPLNDLADYDGDFFLANVDMALRTQTETSWGIDIPEDIFLHYVLPCRVNNENLDSFRIVYYDEILNRIKGMGVIEAALEINHWCHEKVTYQSSDVRTSAPMSTVLSARGRCGEESTFVVAALRTAGIPARQVYTPRWAHSDDNHAWVEIWVRGEWFYMGACEPEPVLDYGWFTEPARRAMMVNTKSFGAFWGNENSITKHLNYTEVNNLAKYALTKIIFVKVFDKAGFPVKKAQVEYKLYNYAEFYPLSVVPTDESGISQLETGYGDLLIWAYNGNDFDFKKISVGETDTIVLTLNRKVGENYSLDLNLDVPIIRSPLPGPSEELVKQNAVIISEENIIRQKYIDSWMKPADANELALKVNIDTSKFKRIIERSMGNYKEISRFIIETPDSLRQLAISMLELLPDKDLRDTKESILTDHLKYGYRYNYQAGKNEFDLYLNYVLNPRISNENLVSWRSYFFKVIPEQLIPEVRKNPSLIVKYLNDNLSLANDENYYNVTLTPKGVIALKVTDTESRDICFVAICRTFGIPSRLEAGSNVPQYFFNSTWNDVYFDDLNHSAQNKGFLKLISSETKPVPEYYTHFTIARFEKGRYNTLEYDYNKKVTDFKKELSLLPGNYMIVTGNRLANGRILSNITFFDLSGNEHKTIDIKLRHSIPENQITGSVDLDSVINLLNNKNCTSDRIKNKGVAIFWIDSETEPTKHIFNDLPLLKAELDSWGGYFLYLNSGIDYTNIFNPGKLLSLPANSLFGVDKELNVLKDIVKTNMLPEINLPYVILTDKKGNILFKSVGYRIGIGEQILKYAQE